MISSQDIEAGAMYAACALFFGLVAFGKHISLARSSEDEPVLSSEDMLGAGAIGLQSLSQGTVAGFPYNLLTNITGRVMVNVQLGHNTWSHIVAYGDKSRLSEETQSLISSKWLEPAVLEGDFPDYFHMYCNKELQDVVRELFTPDVMEDFIAFCRSCDFELFHDTLYMSGAEYLQNPGDATELVSGVADFLTKQGAVLRRITP